LKKTVIPEEQNVELKNLIEAVLPVLKTHFQHAEIVEKGLK
jgi:predicted outer membrane protein